MEYFSNLGLGQTQTAIAMALYAFSFFGLLLLSLFIRGRLRNKYLLIVTATLILSVPVCTILEITIGNVIFSKVHRLKNRHMPEPAECLEYEPVFSYLKAKYKVRAKDLKPAELAEFIQLYELQAAEEDTDDSEEEE